jgi:hypothetical protein
MKIQTFLNMGGLIHGNDPKRIRCDKSGVLVIGTTEVRVTANEDEILPVLQYGASGEYEATFTTDNGEVYKLEKPMLHNGRIKPPPASAVELMELRVRADKAELERDFLREEINRLDKIFDTDSLNFLIR